MWKSHWHWNAYRPEVSSNNGLRICLYWWVNLNIIHVQAVHLDVLTYRLLSPVYPEQNRRGRVLCLPHTFYIWILRNWRICLLLKNLRILLTFWGLYIAVWGLVLLYCNLESKSLLKSQVLQDSVKNFDTDGLDFSISVHKRTVLITQYSSQTLYSGVHSVLLGALRCFTKRI